MSVPLEGEPSLEAQVAKLSLIVTQQQAEIESLRAHTGIDTNPLLVSAQRHWITNTIDSIGWWTAALGAGGVFRTAAALVHADPVIQDNIWVLGFAFVGRYGGRVGNYYGTNLTYRYLNWRETRSQEGSSLPNFAQTLNRPLRELRAVALAPFFHIPI